jgi:hypothetical protein
VNDCIQIVKQTNNLDDATQVVIVYKTKDAALDVQTALNANVIYTSAVKFDLYNSATGEKLDTSVCSNTKSQFKVPLKFDKGLNMNKYRTYKQDSIDTFDPNDPAFTQKCFSYIDKDSNMDTTINYRRKYYFQAISAKCNSLNGKCFYTEINSDDYVTCDCAGEDPTSEVSGALVPTQLDPISPINIDIIKCIGPIFVFIF